MIPAFLAAALLSYVILGSTHRCWFIHFVVACLTVGVAGLAGLPAALIAVIVTVPWVLRHHSFPRGSWLACFPVGLAAACLSEPVWFIDAVNYQMKIPRDISRFGLSALDATFIHQGFTNPVHLFISALWFSDAVAKSLWIGIQAGAAAGTIQLIFERSSRGRTGAVLAFLAIPLVWILVTVEAMDHLAIFVTTRTILDRNPASRITWVNYGLLWWIKPTAFVLAIPFFLQTAWSAGRKIAALGTISCVVSGYWLLQWMTVGTPGFPFSIMLLGHPDTIEAFHGIRWMNDLIFHDRETGHLINAVLIRTWPLFVALPLALWASKTRATAGLIVASCVLWVICFPQTRFLIYLVPVSIIVIWNSVPDGRWLRALSFFAVALFVLRGPTMMLSRLAEVPLNIAGGPLANPAVTAFADHIPDDAVTYVERDHGWTLPGRVIVDKTWQTAWVYDRPWLEQMLDTGVTHLLIKTGGRPHNPQFRHEDLRYSAYRDAAEKKRLTALSLVIESARPLVTIGDWTLYRLSRGPR